MERITATLMRDQAARLFVAAVEARGKGSIELADMLTAAASRCLDRAIEAESAAVPPITAQEQPPVIQQQQQTTATAAKERERFKLAVR